MSSCVKLCLRLLSLSLMLLSIFLCVCWFSVKLFIVLMVFGWADNLDKFIQKEG